MMRSIRFASMVLFAVFFVLAGLNHFRQPGFYVQMIPPWLPSHLLLVQISGVAEIVLGAALMIPGLSRWAAWGIIALLLAVFPANIQMAVHPELFPAFSRVALLWRLPMQLVLAGWAFVYTRPNAEPRT